MPTTERHAWISSDTGWQCHHWLHWMFIELILQNLRTTFRQNLRVIATMVKLFVSVNRPSPYIELAPHCGKQYHPCVWSRIRCSVTTPVVTGCPRFADQVLTHFFPALPQRMKAADRKNSTMACAAGLTSTRGAHEAADAPAQPTSEQRYLVLLYGSAVRRYVGCCFGDLHWLARFVPDLYVDTAHERGRHHLIISVQLLLRTNVIIVVILQDSWCCSSAEPSGHAYRLAPQTSRRQIAKVGPCMLRRLPQFVLRSRR